MTIRNLDFMFNPSSVVLVGASQRPGSMGAVLARNLVSAGFKGDIYPINPECSTIEGLPA
jgi:acetyltransferase